MKLQSFSKLIDKIEEKRTILSAQIALTNRCNERCVHCFVCKKSVDELSMRKIKSVLSELRELNCMEVTYTGGEATLRKDFFDILYFTRQKGLGIRILSNGTLINEVNIEQLKEISPLNVQISLYGVTAKIHDFTTRLKGSFERTMHAIKLLKANKIPFSIATMVMNHNFHEMPLLKNMAKEERWKILFDFIITPTDSRLKTPLKTRVTDAQIRAAYNLGLLPFVNKNGELKRYNKKYLCINNVGSRYIFISSQGEVFPVIDLRIKIGNLNRNSVYDIWYNSRKLNWIRSLTLSDFECSECRHVFACRWNPGLALLEYNDLFKKPKELCRFTKFIASQQKNNNI